MEIVTGYRGQAHITAAQTGAFNAGMFGQGEYVMENGEQLSAAIITNNLIRISDGDIVMQGRHITIAKGTYEEVQIANGLAGMNRNDLIVVRYSKNATTGIEDARLVVIQGISTEGTAQDPEYQQGDILAGDLEADMPLYRIRLSGLNVEEPECLFEKQNSLHSMVKALVEVIYPVGAIYMSVNSTNPSSFFGGTWVAWGAGKVPVGINTADDDFKTVEKTGGEKTHVLTTAQMPAHTHKFTGSSVNTGIQSNRHIHSVYYYSAADTQTQNKNAYNMTIWTNKYNIAADNMVTEEQNHTHSVTAAGTNANTGSGAAHNNLQPYITCYMWKRIA